MDDLGCAAGFAGTAHDSPRTNGPAQRMTRAQAVWVTFFVSALALELESLAPWGAPVSPLKHGSCFLAACRFGVGRVGGVRAKGATKLQTVRSSGAPMEFAARLGCPALSAPFGNHAVHIWNAT